MSQLVFLTFFLGLVSGPQTVSLNASSDIHTVAILLDEQKVATLQPPFTGTIDLGAKLAPRLLVAVGYDEKGNEIARASQVLNVPHPPAEATIVMSDGNKRAEIRWMQRVHEKPSETLLRVDDRTIPLDAAFGAALPPLDPTKPHVIEAELRFASGAVVRHDVTLAGGAYSGSVDSELTPVIVRGAAQREKLSACFGAGVPAVEKSRAVVVVIKDPDPSPVVIRLSMQYRRQNWPQSPEVRLALPLAANTSESILWPVMQERTRESNPTMDVYGSSGPFDAHNLGMLWTITRRNQSLNARAPRRYADAVAVAGMMAAEQGTRRAVVLLLQPGYKEESTHDAATVRSYLQSIGVPLHVWAIDATKEQLEAWGEVSDISTPKLERAVNRLRDDLASQTVVWLATDAWHALRDSAKPCQ
ncbi:MAG TPA: hypothetical protein VGJ88_05815 [Thermoanaerobaculia bacterium]